MNNHDVSFFYVKSDYRLVKVELSKLLYVECEKDYMRLHIEGQRPLMTLMTMKTLEERLPQPQFIRIHRSIIVQVSKIEFINQYGKNVQIYLLLD